jgi:predicted anti-sigma-YlaC factor YlaD
MKICNTPECRRMRALLSDFLDHSLHWRTSRSLEAHLESCPPCRVYIASVERTILLYRERPVVDVPVAVRGHLRELLRERHEKAPKKGAGRCCAGARRPTDKTVPPSARKTAKKP